MPKFIERVVKECFEVGVHALLRVAVLQRRLVDIGQRPPPVVRVERLPPSVEAFFLGHLLQGSACGAGGWPVRVIFEAV